ncbi:Short-chain-fatty-acid--CoA ligase [Trichostrongylus colubriformis]|uniref:Medium-chain acyl-CoA ligase ACSF2, mitochondrial n=1 Tax=Trichostrongylus colubriformis TaxID=6319 RepID=A0AAN8FPQ0_TRICO
MVLVNINPSYQSEELRFALAKVDIKALITPLGFKKSNYYQSIRVCYGTTETCAIFISILEDPPEQRIKSVGHIMDHLEAAVVDKHGKILPRGEKGEVIIRGYSVMRCYWNNEEQTKKEITADGCDIAVMHDNGTISIVGRSKDMIVRGGENIYPAEVEQFLFKHPKIEDAHIVGVPDERYGESVCAWIRLHESAEGQVNEEHIKNWCKGKIAHFKIPRYILFKKEHEFPLTVTGKVKKFEIREQSKIELGLQHVVPHFQAI